MQRQGSPGNNPARRVFTGDAPKLADQGSPLSTHSILGILASLFSMASFVPQVLKVWRDDQSEGVSRRTYALTVTGFSFWIAYGAAKADLPIIVTNSVCFALSLAVLVKLVRRRGKARKEP